MGLGTGDVGSCFPRTTGWLCPLPTSTNSPPVPWMLDQASCWDLYLTPTFRAGFLEQIEGLGPVRLA